VVSNSAQVSVTGSGPLTISGTINGTGYGDAVNIADPNTTITAAGGPITITGKSGGANSTAVVVTNSAKITGASSTSIAITGTGGVTVSVGAQISVTGSGSLAVKGTTSGSGFGVDITDTGTTLKAAGGPITITGSAGAGGTAVNVVKSSQILGTVATLITITGDSMIFDATVASHVVINSSGSIVTLQPLTAGTPINLGGNNTAGVLGLTNAELNDFTTGALHIGDSTAGTITVSAPVAPSKTSTLALITGAGITTSGSGALTIANLRLRAAGTVALTSWSNAVGTLAAQTSGSGPFTFHDSTPSLTVGTVEGVSGITAAGGAISISTTRNLTVNQPVTTATAAGDTITLLGGLSGNSALDIFAPLTGNTAVVQSGPAIENITVRTTLPTPLSILGGTGTNTLIFDVSGQPIFVSPGKYVVPGQQPLTYSSIATLWLNNAGSVSTFYGPNTADRSTALAGLTPDERFVQVLYLGALGRAGSKAELDSWVKVLHGPGGSQEVVANAIERSAEARDHLVKTWYLTYLGRAAKGGEEQGWVNALLAGQSEEQVLSSLLGTPEFYNRAPTITGDGGKPSDQEYIKALYVVLLNRMPSSTEVNSWVSALATMGRAGVAFRLQTSTEGRTDRIEAVYNALLHRPGDSQGLAHWVSSGLDLTTIRVAIESTAECFSNG
jgi:hypothetical protein